MVSPSAFGVASGTSATPGTRRELVGDASTSATGSVLATMSPVTSERAVEPGAELSAEQVVRVALRRPPRRAAGVGQRQASGSAAGRPRRAGAPASRTTTVTSGRAVTSRSPAGPRRCGAGAGRGGPGRRRGGAGARARGTRRWPRTPSSAGSRLSAMPTATTTASAALRPMTVRKGMRATASPTRAIMTVSPAKTTAEPAVATARPADSSGSRPCGQLVAVAGQDEQRVVDPHGQADHHRQQRRGGSRAPPTTVAVKTPDKEMTTPTGRSATASRRPGASRR